MLTYADLVGLFPSRERFIDQSIKFHTVSAFANETQPKGIFIPLYQHSSELKEAIAKGAIGTLWESGKPLPDYTPNHFIVFYTNDLWKGLKLMLEKYSVKLNSHDIREYTQFKWKNETQMFADCQIVDMNVIKMIEKIEEQINNGERD